MHTLLLSLAVATPAPGPVPAVAVPIRPVITSKPDIVPVIPIPPGLECFPGLDAARTQIAWLNVRQEWLRGQIGMDASRAAWYVARLHRIKHTIECWEALRYAYQALNAGDRHLPLQVLRTRLGEADYAAGRMPWPDLNELALIE